MTKRITWSEPFTNKWRFEIIENMYYQHYCLDARGGSGAECTPVQMWKCSRSRNQRWRFFGKNVPGEDLEGPPEPPEPPEE